MLRLAETLGVEASAIGPTTTSTDIESWDSMGTMAILLWLNEEYGMEFAPQETTKLQSVASIVKLLRDAGH
jgi:acyl carrier protein